jgi:hypothetical protein
MKYLLYILLWGASAAVYAQQGGEVFSFLRYPASARANALGGHAVAVVEPDAALVFGNPGLLGAEMDRTVSLGYMNFFSSVSMGSAIYSRAVGENGAWAAGATYAGYGSFLQTSAENRSEGEFSVGDVSINAFYAHNLSSKWRGGIALKFLYSSLERYSSVGLAADAGLSFFDADRDFSFGLALKNVGAQLRAYNEARFPLPLDFQAGFSKKPAHAPFRFSVAAISLHRWEGVNFFEHFSAGVEFIPTESFWLGIGYNPQTARDMKLETGNSLGGFSAGGGFRIKGFEAGVSVARYHPSALSVLMSVSMSCGSF